MDTPMTTNPTPPEPTLAELSAKLDVATVAIDAGREDVRVGFAHERRQRNLVIILAVTLILAVVFAAAMIVQTNAARDTAHERAARKADAAQHLRERRSQCATTDAARHSIRVALDVTFREVAKGVTDPARRVADEQERLHLDAVLAASLPDVNCAALH